MSQPGWPAILADGPVVLRPYRRSDARAWAEVRRANEKWLGKWEPTPYGSWHDLNSPAAFRAAWKQSADQPNTAVDAWKAVGEKYSKDELGQLARIMAVVSMLRQNDTVGAITVVPDQLTLPTEPAASPSITP